METALVQQFLNFFQDFLNLCQLDNWPNNETTLEEFKNAFIISVHIEKCLDRLQKRLLLDDFLAALNTTNNIHTSLLKKCLSDPPKYILQKIITCSAKISQIDSGLQIFLELFSPEKLELYLSDLMIEAASKETLLSNLSVEIPSDKLLDFKSRFLLAELSEFEDCRDAIVDMLNDYKKDTVDILIVSMLNKDIEFSNAVNSIVNAFISIMSIKNSSKKAFWRTFLYSNESNFIKICLEHANLFKMISKALLDCGRLLKENMSAEFFYIDLSYSELTRITKKICQNDNLKIEFMDIIYENNEDVIFWENILL